MTADGTSPRRVEAVRAAGSGLIGLVGRPGYDLLVSGRENVPTSGPLVVAVNHFSHLDAVLATHVVGRNVHYLAVDELFGESAFFDRLIGFFGAIPMSRVRPPLGALRRALELLAEGGAVGLFPEGRRVAHWGESFPKQGAAWLSLRSGAPLLPITIIGSEGTLSVTTRSFRRTSLWVCADAPLHPDDFREEADPRGTMTDAWAQIVGRRVAHWSPPD